MRQDIHLRMTMDEGLAKTIYDAVQKGEPIWLHGYACDVVDFKVDYGSANEMMTPAGPVALSPPAYSVEMRLVQRTDIRPRDPAPRDPWGDPYSSRDPRWQARDVRAQQVADEMRRQTPAGLSKVNNKPKAEPPKPKPPSVEEQIESAIGEFRR